MAKQIVTLYIDDTSLRLMVTQGKQVEQWVDMPLESGWVENNVVIKETEVVDKIKQLFEDQKIKTKKVSVGISGFHCLTRPITFPQLPKEMLDEAVRREAERALPVPLEELYISWQSIPAPEGKTQVFLTAIPRKMADALLKTLVQAGLKPIFMDVKPLLLARLAKEATAVIVDVQATEYDVAIMTDGLPQPVRTIPFADEAPSWEEKLAMIKSDLDRTITFYNSNNTENPLTPSVPIFVSGALADEAQLCQALSEEIGHPVVLLTSPLDCPEWFATSRHMVNIALAFQELSSGKDAGPLVANVNALPASYQPKPISLTNIAALSAAAVAAVAIVFLVMMVQDAPAKIAATRVRLNTANEMLQQRLSQRQELTKSVTELQGDIAQVTASRDNLEAALSGLEEQSTGINRDLDATMGSLPTDVSLSSIGHITSILTITGRAPSEKQVLLYLTNLDTSGRFSDITITNMTRIEGEEDEGGSEGIDFTFIGTLQTQIIGASSMEIALGSLPATVSLTGVDSAEGTLTLNGRSPDEDKVFSYLRALEASGKFSQITLSSMARTEEGETDFSLVLKGEEILGEETLEEGE